MYQIQSRYNLHQLYAQFLRARIRHETLDEEILETLSQPDDSQVIKAPQGMSQQQHNPFSVVSDAIPKI